MWEIFGRDTIRDGAMERNLKRMMEWILEAFSHRVVEDENR